MKLRYWTMIAAVGLLAGCGYVDEYEAGVYDYEPIYCYRSLGETVCHREPDFKDSKRLVNYYGPHPSRYDPPEEAEAPEPKPPTQATDYYVVTPEPIPVDGVLIETEKPSDD